MGRIIIVNFMQTENDQVEFVFFFFLIQTDSRCIMKLMKLNIFIEWSTCILVCSSPKVALFFAFLFILMQLLQSTVCIICCMYCKYSFSPPFSFFQYHFVLKHILLALFFYILYSFPNNVSSLFAILPLQLICSILLQHHY